LRWSETTEAIPIKFRDCRTCLWQVRNDREEKLRIVWGGKNRKRKAVAQNLKLKKIVFIFKLCFLPLELTNCIDYALAN